MKTQQQSIWHRYERKDNKLKNKLAITGEAKEWKIAGLGLLVCMQ